MKVSWPAVFATLLIAGVIHIAVVLGVPHLATKNAWARLAELGDANALVVLPTASPGAESLPFMAPDVRYAICRYDLSGGPVRLGIQILDHLWMIAFYTPQGDNYYAITGGDLKRERIEVIISAQAETLLELEMEATEEVENVVVVRAPQETGLAVIRAPLRGASYASLTELSLRRSSCATREASSLLSAPSTPGAPPLPTTPPLPRRSGR